jgi:hypothetical protein
VLERPTSEQKGGSKISWLQTFALSLLLFIVAPRAIPLPASVQEAFGQAGLNVHQTKVLVSLALVLMSFVSILVGVRHLCGHGLFFTLAIIFVFYAGGDVWRTVMTWSDKPSEGYISSGFVLWYAIGKVLFAVILESSSRIMKDPGRLLDENKHSTTLELLLRKRRACHCATDKWKAIL